MNSFSLLTALGTLYFAYPRCSAGANLQPGQLRSLLDVLKFNARLFYAVVSIMRRAQGSMARNDPATPISDNERRDAPRTMKKLEDSCGDLGARVTQLVVSDVIAAIKSKKKPLTHGKFSELLDEVDSTLRRELSLVNLFVLEPASHRYFEPQCPLFGVDFELRYPSAAYDLEEAAKCLALSRATASVFHLMRIMEIGIRAIARCLKMPEPIKPAEKNWAIILRNIKSEIDARNAQNGWQNALDREFFEGSHALLEAVRVAWRNTTMHVENKYNSDEAEQILLAVRGFMRQLASRCDELGQPVA
jgi:hypothetical protein